METLTTAFEKATAEKLRFQEEVNRTNKTIELANRLVKGLEVGTHLITSMHIEYETNISIMYSPCNSKAIQFECEYSLSLVYAFVCVFQSENVRWAHSVAQYHEQEETLCGDVLLTAAFISYAGSFSKKYRQELLDNLWMPFLRSQKVLDVLLQVLYDYRKLRLCSCLNLHLVLNAHLFYHFTRYPSQWLGAWIQC